MLPAQEMTGSNIGQPCTNENGEGMAYGLLNLEKKCNQSFGHLQDRISNGTFFCYLRSSVLATELMMGNHETRPTPSFLQFSVICSLFTEQVLFRFPFCLPNYQTASNKKSSFKIAKFFFFWQMGDREEMSLF